MIIWSKIAGGLRRVGCSTTCLSLELRCNIESVFVSLKSPQIHQARPSLYFVDNVWNVSATWSRRILFGSSQIDALEAGQITFEDSLLIRWENVVFIHFLQLTSTWSGGKLQRWSRLPPRHQFDYFQHWGWCFYGWNLVITRTVVSLTLGTPYCSNHHFSHVFKLLLNILPR